MSVLTGASGAKLLLNPHLDRTHPYGPAQRAILSREGAEAAMQVIGAWPGYAPTPVRLLEDIARTSDVARVALKDEGFRFNLASFKALGGAYAVERLVRKRGGAAGLTVTCATDGNHGRAVAWGASRMGVRAVIYVHETVSEGRVRAIEGFGAEVRRVAGNYDDSVRASAQAAEENGWTIVSDTSWPGYEEIPADVMQGYALLAAEAHDQGERPSHVFVQGGVGGLAAGVLSWFWEAQGAARPRLVVVEPENAACLYESAAAGQSTVVHGALETIMAGLACGEPSLLAWKLLDPGADAFIRIPDDCAAKTMRVLAERGIVCGESGVAGLAGFLAIAENAEARRMLGIGPAARILCIGTEGATDPDIYRSIVGHPAEAIMERMPA